MKKLRNLTLMILTGVIIFSCSSTKYLVIHKDLTIPTQCNFEKFTEEEKQSMIEPVGHKIYRNQENCRIRQERINSLINTHNQAHKGKE